MRAILFDLDGTLVDSVPLWVTANLEALQTRGCTIEQEEFLRRIYHKGLHYRGVLEELGLPTTDAETFYRMRDDRFEELLTKSITWIEGAEDALQDLSKRFSLGLLTGSRRRFIEAMDLRLHFSGIFSAIATYEDTGDAMKPDPFGLHLLMRQLDVEASDCIYIGDQTVDVKAAHAAGMRCCLVRWRETPPGAEKEADLIAPTIGEVPRLFS